MNMKSLPLPGFYEPEKVSQVWRVPYHERARQARLWAQEHDIRPAAEDTVKIALVLIDVQNTFCLPDFELFVGGRSGNGAVEDNQRLCEFIYRNLGSITQIVATMDTHYVQQIFHPQFLVDAQGNHPEPMTLITVDDIENGKWRFNPLIAPALGVTPDYGQQQLIHYTRSLKQSGKYDLTIWPYHAMLGGIGHALVSSVEEAMFFHAVARYSQPRIEIKGNHPFTEHYSAFGPEVMMDVQGNRIGEKNKPLFTYLLTFDAVIIAGQAKSHCVSSSIDDFLKEIQARDPGLAQKVYLLDDCASPVVVPGVVDYTEAAEKAYQRFAEAGMHRVLSTEPIEAWGGIPKR